MKRFEAREIVRKKATSSLKLTGAIATSAGLRTGVNDMMEYQHWLCAMHLIAAEDKQFARMSHENPEYGTRLELK